MEGERPTTSTRDLAATRHALAAWLAGKVGDVTVSELQAPPTNGMSSETILFDATWGGRTVGLVGRIAPDPADKPVFPSYDIPGQFRTMSLVRQLTDVPVPEPLWVEDDPSVLGQPFFVMRRVGGVVPPDVMPYTFGDNWLFDATAQQQQALADRSIDVLSRLHAVADAGRRFGYLHDGVAGGTPLHRHFRKELLDYYAWAAQDTRSPLIEACLDWLQANWPEHEGETVLSWGDARIGNILYRDFAPVAVLDWEMASLGPREIDVAWLQFLHLFFEDLAARYGMPGMPSFLRRDDVIGTYERQTGHRCRDMDWFGMLAATRHGIIILRTGMRGVWFGEATMPDDVDDLIIHRTALEQMLVGTYWKDR